ncbi:MAG: YncE family protein [Acidobacteria bacterium]|nr:YncE family protein [Acidobacteriota bacterium]
MTRLAGAARAAILVLACVVSYAHTAASTRSMTLRSVGAGIYEVVVGMSTDAVYVASTEPSARRIFVLDPKTLRERTSLDTDGRPVFGLAFNDRTRVLYGTSTTTGTVVAIDAVSGRTIATIGKAGDPGAHVFRALVDPVANRVYVSIPEPASRIWVIDGATHTIAHEITNVGGRSTGLALDTRRNRLFTCSIASSEIIEIDLATRQVVRRFASGGAGTTHLEYDGAADRLYASHQRSGTVTALDVASGKVVETIATGDGALGLALDTARQRLYVTNRGAETVSVIDTRTLTVIETRTGGTRPNTVAVDPRTGVAYVTFKSREGSPDRVGRIAPD